MVIIRIIFLHFEIDTYAQHKTNNNNKHCTRVVVLRKG